MSFFISGSPAGSGATWGLLLVLLAAGICGRADELKVDFAQLNESHDIPDLPTWGPYSKRYAGISHISDWKQGLRFDFTVLPGFYRFKTLVPNVRFASDYYPWEANASLNRLTYRYELEWKDREYVDVTYSLLDSHSVLVAMHCVNHTLLPQNLALNLMGFLAYPNEFSSVRAEFPKTTTWVNAVDYERLTQAQARSDDNLVPNGWLRSEVRGSDYLDGSAVGAGFGANAGDQVVYDLKAIPRSNGVITLRYRLKEHESATFQCTGIATPDLALTGTGQFEATSIPFSVGPNGDHHLILTSKGGSGVELNGLFVGPAEDAPQIHVQPAERHPIPGVTTGATNSVVLKYADVDDYYGIAWTYSPSTVREILNDELDIFFRDCLQNHVDRVLVGNRLGHFENVFLRPVAVPADGERTIYALICDGPEAAVQEETLRFAAAPSRFVARAPRPDDPFAHLLPQGRPYVLGQSLMRATMLANLVYPVYTQKHYIRHFSPGKWWDSLYTWDEGLLALGLGEVNPNLAVECLNAYTTPADSQSAFIEHGSVVPTQATTFFDLWNQTQSPELARYFYPRLKRYYEFLAGRGGSSTTRRQPSNLLQTWDYFYNSGGWDDYPAQVAVHARHQEQFVTPVIPTAQCIRFAKILRLAARSLALEPDLAEYDHDIQIFSSALQSHAWDPRSGYFSYVVHDRNGRPTGFFTTGQGVNLNQGLDGAYPLFAGICTADQQAILLAKLFSPTNLWTPSGMGVVDQSAPYYRHDGYWNGTVWMPHQWFMWKTMLDLGRPDLAWIIAHKALDVWKTETDESYNVFEHFLADTGRGAGWHQFSSLSAPVLNWFAAYYQPGTVTGGFEILLQHAAFNATQTGFTADLMVDDATAPHPRSLIVCLKPAPGYQAALDGAAIDVVSPFPGLVTITLPPTNRGGRLVVKPAAK